MRSNLTRPRRIGAVAAALALTVSLAACGGDDDDDAASSASDTTEAAEGDDSVTDTPEAGEETSEYCALVLETFEQDSPPNAEQLAQYQELAPAEIADPVAIAAPALLEAGDDTVALFNAIAQDETEEAVEAINEFETAECGVEHDPAPDDEIDAAAARVDVAATEYEFTDPQPLTAGATSFVLTNNGAQTHFLAIVKLAEGATLDEALQSDDDSLIEGFWSSGLAAPGGADEEVVNVELESGTYGLACFIPDVDGEPHAVKGMVLEVTVP